MKKLYSSYIKDESKEKRPYMLETLIIRLVGKMGFEPTTSWSRTKRATKLRYFPIKNRRVTIGRFRPNCQVHPF